MHARAKLLNSYDYFTLQLVSSRENIKIKISAPQQPKCTNTSLTKMKKKNEIKRIVSLLLCLPQESSQTIIFFFCVSAPYACAQARVNFRPGKENPT